MVHFLLSLPTFWGVCAAMVVAATVGPTAYFISSKVMSRGPGDTLVEPIVNLFRTTAMFVSLLLSISFAHVINQLGEIDNAIDREAVAISDTFYNLRFFDIEETLEIRATLLEYTQSVIDDDWPALANDELGQRSEALRRHLAESALNLKPATPKQEKLWSRILSDITIISDHRLIRLEQALAGPPVFVYVVMVGFVVSMVLFGIYQSQAQLLACVLLFSLLIGFIMYLILALSDPYQGAFSVTPTIFEDLVQRLRADFPQE